LLQVLGIAGSLVVPALVDRRPSQGWLGIAVATAWAAMVVGLLPGPSAWAAWAVVGGLAQGAGISLAFTLLVLRSRDDGVVRRLSSMSQVVGYTVGATGPLAVGALFEATDGWTAPLVLLLAVCAAMALAGLVAGRDVSIGSPTR
jgi:MFS transporter, CP family, cyanate transporter